MYCCKICGKELVKWQGRCPACLEWGSVEEVADFIVGNKKNRSQEKARVVHSDEIKEEFLKSYSLEDRELKHLLGGKIYAGASYLITGEPGIGKSTFLLFIAHEINRKILYLCGEETSTQVKKRMVRTNNQSEQLYFTEQTNIALVQKKILQDHFEIIMIDSLQTIYDPDISSAPGSINQMKYAVQEMVNFCRLNKIVLLMTGHINKSGETAGPKLIEHLVDTSFFFYATKSVGSFLDIRVIRVLKNRLGTVDVSALFFMDENGFKPLTQEKLSQTSLEDSSPDQLNENRSNHIGTCLFPHFIGRRLVFYEVECLVVASKLSMPRRSVEGIASSRLYRILAIMEKYCELDFSTYDVYVQVTGGFRGDDLLIDLCIIACIYSSLKNFPLPRRTIFLGEVGLSGKIKRVSDLRRRTKEIDSYGHFLYFSSHQDKNQVIAVKEVSGFLKKLEESKKIL